MPATQSTHDHQAAAAKEITPAVSPRESTEAKQEAPANQIPPDPALRGSLLWALLEEPGSQPKREDTSLGTD